MPVITKNESRQYPEPTLSALVLYPMSRSIMEEPEPGIEDVYYGRQHSRGRIGS